jgi:hypothetical protein
MRIGGLIMKVEQSFLMEIISKLEGIERDTVDLDAKDEIRDLIDFIEAAID